VSSPLSRALATADVIVPPNNDKDTDIKRVCVEDFREVNGWLLNAQRRNRSELQETFPAWDFSQISPTDELWTNELEEQVDCAHRGYDGLCWLLNQPKENILLVCHGGILRFTMDMIPTVCVVDGRTESSLREDSKARFDNCELRKYELTWDENSKSESKPVVTLTEVDL
jgi:broad specificity phosphatase PhoE